MSVLSPKIIFPLVTMGNAMFTTIDSAGAEIQQDLQAKSPGLMAFSKKNKRFLINVTSRIGAVFLEGLFLELKKDIIKVVKSLVLYSLKTKIL